MLNVILAAFVTITGVVVDTRNEPLAGVTVTLTLGDVSRTAVTDVDGRYTFVGVQDALYHLRSELAGFGSTETTVRAGSEVAPLRLDPAVDTITVACDLLIRCGSEAPATPHDLPLCSDYERNAALIEAMQYGHDFAAPLLRARFEQTLSLAERHRIGSALLERNYDDGSIWNELLTRAATCVRFPDEEAPEYTAWCAERGVTPAEHWWASYDALLTILGERRARPLLRAALESEIQIVAEVGIMGLVMQKDEESRPAIERALARFPDAAAPAELRLWSAAARPPL